MTEQHCRKSPGSDQTRAKFDISVKFSALRNASRSRLSSSTISLRCSPISAHVDLRRTLHSSDGQLCQASVSGELTCFCERLLVCFCCLVPLPPHVPSQGPSHPPTCSVCYGRGRFTLLCLPAPWPRHEVVGIPGSGVSCVSVELRATPAHQLSCCNCSRSFGTDIPSRKLLSESSTLLIPGVVSDCMTYCN